MGPPCKTARRGATSEPPRSGGAGPRIVLAPPGAEHGRAGGRRAERGAARTVPLGGGRHPARIDRQQRLQDLHLRPAVPEAAVGPVRGGGGEADRRRRACGRGPDRSGRAPVLRAEAGAVGRHRCRGRRHRRDPQQGVLGVGGTERRVGGRARRYRLQRRTQARRRAQPRHRAGPAGAALLAGFAPQRPHGGARSARPRLRVPDQAVRRRRGQEGRRVLHAAHTTG